MKGVNSSLHCFRYCTRAQFPAPSGMVHGISQHMPCRERNAVTSRGRGVNVNVFSYNMASYGMYASVRDTPYFFDLSRIPNGLIKYSHGFGFTTRHIEVCMRYASSRAFPRRFSRLALISSVSHLSVSTCQSNTNLKGSLLAPLRLVAAGIEHRLPCRTRRTPTVRAPP